MYVCSEQICVSAVAIARMQTRLTNVVLYQVEFVIQVGRYTLSRANDTLQLPGLQAVSFCKSGCIDVKHTKALLHRNDDHGLDLRQ